MSTQYIIRAVGTEHPLEVLYNISKINFTNMFRENFENIIVSSGPSNNKLVGKQNIL